MLVASKAKSVAVTPWIHSATRCRHDYTDKAKALSSVEYICAGECPWLVVLK